MPLRLRFSETELAAWANKYAFPLGDAEPARIGPTVHERGYLLLPELRQMAQWKSPRIGRRIDANSESVVEDVTRLAFGTDDDSLAIRALRLLSGVGWPMASVLLHFCARKPYPVLDVRALWSVGYDTPPHYTAALWLEYTQFCRDLAHRTGHSMREIDRALWQYSKASGKSARTKGQRAQTG